MQKDYDPNKWGQDDQPVNEYKCRECGELVSDDEYSVEDYDECPICIANECTEPGRLVLNEKPYDY